jgi:rhamnogalacturonyl hydrolase YesR
LSSNGGETFGKFRESLCRLEQYVREHDYSGYDPYDALNTELFEHLPTKYLKVLVTQFFVYSPVNFRKLVNTQPGKNPKGLGLFLQAYCNMYKANLIDRGEFDAISSYLVQELIRLRSTGYTNYCWGFNFPWQDITRYGPRYLPSIVNTSYIGNAFLDLYEVTQEQRYLDIAESCSRFILNDLNVTETDTGICFSYTPVDHHLVHNANVLGAAFLSRVSSITGQDELLNSANRAFEFTLSHQHDDGSWAYSMNPNTGKERNQIDFHQGFILDALCDFLKCNPPKKPQLEDALLLGAQYYLNCQFDVQGRSKWRMPRKWPIDIHHQAQGAITFCKLFEYTHSLEYLRCAEKISSWTIDNVQDRVGYFHHQRWPYFTNKISYMRWGQAWMMLGLSMLMHTTEAQKQW